MSEKDRIIVLADVSSSMADRDRGSETTRFGLLRRALTNLPEGVKIIAFGDNVREVSQIHETKPYGGTPLHLAIMAAMKYEPIRTVIISDGEPDDRKAAMDAAQALTGIIDVVYCGDPKNAVAKRWLESLAKAGAGGFYQTGDQVDVLKQLPAVVAGLLTK